MNTFPALSFRSSFTISLTLGLMLSALALTGCADMMVNTRETRANGVKQYENGQYAESAATFRSAIRGNPTDYASHYFLGASLAQLGSYEQAIQQYKATLDIMNVDMVGREDHAFRIQVLDALAMAVVGAKDHDLQSVTLKDSPPYENQFLLAKIDRGMGDPDAALDAYAQAAMLAPKDFAIAKDYGIYLLQLSQKDRARGELMRAYALNPSDAQVASALRQVGVVPGPSLKNESDLAKPIVPVGPIPEVQFVVPAGAQESSSRAE